MPPSSAAADEGEPAGRLVERARARQDPRSAPPENNASDWRPSACAAAASPCVLAVMSRASARCAARASGRDASSASSASISLALELGEPAQVRADVAVVGIQPVLVERERRRPLRVEPDRVARLALAELRPRRGQQQLVGEAVGRLLGAVLADLARPPDELEAGGDVAPLVRAAHLQLDAHRPVQMPEVVRLKEHVAELGERQAALQAHLDRVLGEHVRHREVLARVAQEVDQRQLAEPVEVVDHRCRAGARREVEEPLELAADRPTFARASRGRAGCARSTARTGHRSSRSHRRRPRSGVRRDAGVEVARRSARGARRAASRHVGSNPMYPLIGRPVASRSANPGVVACRMPRHSSSARRSVPAPAERAAVTGRGPVSSARGRPPLFGRSRPYAIVRA